MNLKQGCKPSKFAIGQQPSRERGVFDFEHSEWHCSKLTATSALGHTLPLAGPSPHVRSWSHSGHGGAVSLMRTSLQMSRSRGCLGYQFAPFGQGGGAVLFEYGPSAEMTVVVEMVVDRGVCGGKLLQGLHVPEASHGALSSSEGLM